MSLYEISSAYSMTANADGTISVLPTHTQFTAPVMVTCAPIPGTMQALHAKIAELEVTLAHCRKTQTDLLSATKRYQQECKTLEIENNKLKDDLAHMRWLVEGGTVRPKRKSRKVILNANGG